jgi:hypothetical protein
MVHILSLHNAFNAGQCAKRHRTATDRKDLMSVLTDRVGRSESVTREAFRKWQYWQSY